MGPKGPEGPEGPRGPQWPEGPEGPGSPEGPEKVDPSVVDPDWLEDKDKDVHAPGDKKVTTIQ